MDALMLPLNWQRVRLGDIANYLTSNLSVEQITQQGKIKVYDVNNFIGYTDTTFISDKPYISIVKDGSVGRVRILPPKTNILSTMGALIADHRTTTEFLFYLLSNFDFKNFTSGSIIPHIYFKDYKEKTIFLPPLNEQIAIANILSALDRYLCALDALILKKEGVKKALSFELLSQRKRLKGFNQAWQRVRLGDIANYLTSNLSVEQITQQGKIKVYDVNNFIGYTDTTFISDKPYISIVKDGSVGRVRILPPKTNILSTMGALIADHRTTTEFLFYLLSNFDFKNFTSGSIIPHIYFKDYKEKTIFLPPLNEQIAIANILSTLDNEIASLKNKKRQFENIKKALNHDLMSAKIRVLKQ
ncbi:restriction endonuclease subunit S [Helicobacter pylori]|uniref:restriction endonuclease subunit S n=1 Tax=Helicobacter pylori TaxID=210 RepID=UPI001FD5D926|nr:restriction endonuclease subunit S [Helicobacter pylori]UOR79130.1 restriction endonuclease subunit S [Helicobacter pylori]